MITDYMTGLIIAGLCLVVLIVTGEVFAQTDIQQAAADAEHVTKYLWEFASFFSILGISRLTQWLKQRRWFPNWSWLTEVKVSEDRAYWYTKLRVFWLRSFNYAGSAALIIYCLLQRYGYDSLTQILVVTLIIEMSAAIVIEAGLSIIHARYPEAAKVARDGLYVADDEHKIIAGVDVTKLMQFAVTGGGVEKRDVPRGTGADDRDDGAPNDFDKTLREP